jgi:hypothetical protein
MSQNDVIIDFDRTADVLYVIRNGYNPDTLANIDSDRVPGLVKRIDAKTNECVGFLIHSFSHRFQSYVDCNQDHLAVLMDLTLKMTNDKTSLSDSVAA